MIDVLNTAQSELLSAHYEVRLTSVDRRTIASFEDDSSMGFVCTFESADSLLDGWRAFESKLLSRHAASFRDAAEKAWNVYMVFLSSAVATSEQARAVRWVEEDLARTRKIAACNLATREDVVRTMLPVLPLQYQPRISRENTTERLLKRIRSIAPGVSDSILDPAVAAEFIIRSLEGQP